jgi:hypothetical protein
VQGEHALSWFRSGVKMSSKLMHLCLREVSDSQILGFGFRMPSEQAVSPSARESVLKCDPPCF